jgi:hypothetical protein
VEHCENRKIQPSEHHWIRRQLYEWGKRCRAMGIGYPNMSTTEKMRVGRGGKFSEPELPPDLVLVDLAVQRVEPQHKLVIAECYTHFGTHIDHMIRLQMPESTYFRRKKLAETRVYWLLNTESEYRTVSAG